MRVCIVSILPPTEGGVADYTENLAHSIRKQGCDVLVMSRRSRQPREYLDVQNVPTWRQGITYPFQVFAKLARSGVEVVHVQHEFFLYGGFVSALFFPIMLALIRLLNKPLIVTIHGVIPLSGVTREFRIDNQIPGPLTLLKVALLGLTKSIAFWSNAIITHTNFFANILKNEYGCPRTKIHVIPHGILEKQSLMTQKQAKAALGLRDNTVILFLGYIARYKGIHLLIDGFEVLSKKHPDWTLVVCGGEHPRLRTSNSYIKYVLELRNKASLLQHGRVIFTGFIQSGDLPTYLSAADIVVLPYTTVMSVSGPFMLAASSNKLILASDIPPFQEMIPIREALFNRSSSEDLAEKLQNILEDHRLGSKVLERIAKIRAESSWDKIGKQTRNLYEMMLTVQ